MTKKSIEFYYDAYQRFKRIDTGQPCRELGKILGVDSTTVTAWRRGRTPESKYGPIDRVTMEQARNMLDQGYTYNSVAKVLSVNAHTLRKHMPNMGWKTGPVKRIDYSLDEYV